MLKIFRIKDLETGKFYSTGRYSYDIPKLVKRGRIYTELGYLRTSMIGRMFEFYCFSYPDLFPVHSGKMTAWTKDGYDHNYPIQKAKEIELYKDHKARGIACFPDRWIVIDETDTTIGTLNEIMK